MMTVVSVDNGDGVEDGGHGSDFYGYDGGTEVDSVIEDDYLWRL